MADDAPITLFEAMLRWSDPAVVERVRREERSITAYDMTEYTRPALLPEGEHHQPGAYHWAAGGPNFRSLDAAWEALERDFSARIVRGEIYLYGVRVEPELQTVPSSIPHLLAGEFQYQFDGNTIRFGRNRFTAVFAARTPFADPSSQTQEAVQSATLHQFIDEPNEQTVRGLTDDEVFMLLEDYARRVVEEPYALQLPSRISFMPMIARKMRHRAGTGEIRGKLAEEAHDLEAWIAERVPSHQAPKADAIENAMRTEYRALKPQSKGMKP